jgi:hypothetical protein
MIESGTRFVAFAGSRVRIDYRGDLAREIVEFLYAGIHDASEHPLQGRVKVEVDAATQLIAVHESGELYYQGAHQADAARALQESVSHSLASGSVGGLLLHSAAVSRHGQIVLLPGASGAGKTTLTGHLVSRGEFRYVTDELSFVTEGARNVTGLPRPMSVKASGRHAVAGLRDARDWSVWVSPVVTLLRPPPPQSDVDEGQALGLVIFPQYRSDAERRLARLTPAECGLRVMACLLNARNLPDHGFPAVAALSRLAPAYSLLYDDAVWASAQIEALTID